MTLLRIPALLLIIAFMAFCSESLPVYVEPEVKLSASIRVLDDNPNRWIGFRDPVSFIINVTNRFDEYLEEDYSIRGKIRLRVKGRSDIATTIEFEHEVQGTKLLLPPEISVPLYAVQWDQTFPSGDDPWNFASSLPGRAWFVAEAEIQPMKRFGAVHTEEHEFYILYMAR